MNSGKVFLVGAGPGDIGLLTLKAKEVLQRAQVVVYDALAGESVLALIPEEAVAVYAGKRSGTHAMTQEKINACLVQFARQGKNVVRLKGGDPFLFGRGGEELEALNHAGIPYEVVPGVTSAIAVPAYCGIPVTHRAYASSLHIITAHKKKGEPLSLDYEALCRLGGTLVFLMGSACVHEICEGLLRSGMPSHTGAALLAKGTLAAQQCVITTLAALPAESERAALPTPAIIVVGDVCHLSKQLRWYEKLPLFGTKVVVTRPVERSRELSAQLRSLGAQVIELPSVQTVAKTELQDKTAQLLHHISRYRWLVFTSPAGVKLFWEQWQKERLDLRRLAGIRIAVVGAGTASALEQRGIYAELIPKRYTAAELGRTLGAELMEKDRVLILRAAKGSRDLIDQIRKNARVPIEIDDVPFYDTVTKDSRVLSVEQIWEEHGNVIVVFASASAVRGFAGMAGGMCLDRVRAACIGEKTAKEAGRYHMQAYTAQEASVPALVELIQKMVT